MFGRDRLRRKRLNHEEDGGGALPFLSASSFLVMLSSIMHSKRDGWMFVVVGVGFKRRVDDDAMRESSERCEAALRAALASPSATEPAEPLMMHSLMSSESSVSDEENVATEEEMDGA